jgi:hypothetical protein
MHKEREMKAMHSIWRAGGGLLAAALCWSGLLATAAAADAGTPAPPSDSAASGNWIFSYVLVVFLPAIVLAVILWPSMRADRAKTAEANPEDVQLNVQI